MEDPSLAGNSSSISDALFTTLCNSIQALGRGFDVTSDIRLLYCKGAPGSRLVPLDEQQTRDLQVSDGVVVPNVSVDIESSTGKRITEEIPVCSFHEVRFLICLVAGFCFLCLVPKIGVYGFSPHSCSDCVLVLKYFSGFLLVFANSVYCCDWRFFFLLGFRSLVLVLPLLLVFQS